MEPHVGRKQGCPQAHRASCDKLGACWLINVCLRHSVLSVEKPSWPALLRVPCRLLVGWHHLAIATKRSLCRVPGGGLYTALGPMWPLPVLPPPSSFPETQPNSCSQIRFLLSFYKTAARLPCCSPGPLSGISSPLFSKQEANLGSIGQVTPWKTQKVPSDCWIMTGWSRESVSALPVCHLQKKF